MMEILPISIGIGLGVSIFLSELFGLAGGGLVVPGYLAVHLTEPLTVGVTFAAAFAAFGLVRALGSVIILFGRRKTVLMILAGYLAGMAARYFIGGRGESLEYQVIGFIIPGLIAVWLDRRGIIESLSSLLTASVVVRLILVILVGPRLNP